jgi:hypothetical protein
MVERQPIEGDHAQPGQRLGHDLGTQVRCEQVAHHGARAHHACAQRSALQRAPGDQRFHGLGAGAAQGGQHIDGHACQQDGATPEAVGQRPPGQLRTPEGQQEGRQRELHLGDLGGERCLDRGQGRQVEISGQRLQPQQQAEQHDDQDGGHGRLRLRGGGRQGR